LYKRWKAQLEEITFGFNSVFDHIDRDTLNYKPNKDKWSIGEIVQHIQLVNESFYPIFDVVAEDYYDPPFLSRFDFIVDFYGRLILKGVEPGRVNKVKTTALWKPQESQVDYKALDRFFNGQTKLGQYVELLIPYAEEEVVIHSPANKFIVYQIDVAIDIIITHEMRHLNQAREVINLLKNKKIFSD
jgi:hypothetical protein